MAIFITVGIILSFSSMSCPPTRNCTYVVYIDGLMGESAKKSDLFHFEDNTRLVKILKIGGEEVSRLVQFHLLVLVQDPSQIADFSLLRSQPAQSTGGAR